MTTSTSAVTEVPTPALAFASAGLPGSNFSDAFSGHITRPDVTAMQVARGMFEDPPLWVSSLMAVRDGVVSLVGLKASKGLVARGREGKVGIFPVRSNTGTEVVLGEDDKHLDFRVWVHVEPQGGGYRVTTSTVVRTHNRLGRVYLATIMPFHRLIARQMLSRALRRLNQPAVTAH
jgi:hypothetical protein